ncbi:MAG: hypothetical protein [Bacteriophage sp.]|nr:MAG: hypothetical protein [Bacteriophage sp.]
MKNKLELIQQLEPAFADIAVDTRAIQRVKYLLNEKHNYAPSESNPYLLGQKSAEELGEEQLYWISSVLNKVKSQSISLDKYFTEKEIARYSVSQARDITASNIYPVSIPVMNIAEDHWLATLSIDTIMKWYQSQLLRYNPETQRKMKISRNGTYAIDIKRKSVKEIKHQLLDGTYIPDELAFNMNIGEPELDYEVYENGLILKSGQFDVIDGWHRITAIIQVKGENPDWEYQNFPVHIMAFNTAQANSYIVQKSKNNPLSKGFIRSIDAQDPVSLIIKKINVSPNSLLKGKFGVNSTFLNINIFSQFVHAEFQLTESTAQTLRVANQFIEAFNGVLISTNIQNLDRFDTFAFVYVVKNYSNTDEVVEKFYYLYNNKAKWKTKNIQQTRKMRNNIRELIEKGGDQ